MIPHRRRTLHLPSQPPPHPGVADHLHALGELVDQAALDPSVLFEHGLALLLQHLDLDWALLSRFTATGAEVIWWAGADGREPGPELLAEAHEQAVQVRNHPGRTWVVQDPAGAGTPLKERQVRAYLGVPLGGPGPVSSVLGVIASQPRRFSQAAIALLKAVANLLGKALEIEQLKYDLKLTQDALELTSAVVEDSALEAPRSRLPNLLYLDIWMKASLYLARRRGESMVLVRWRLAGNSPCQAQLKGIADGLRGEDLLVDAGQDEYLLLLPRSTRDGAEVLLERIRQQLGGIAMGVTLWNPELAADRDDLSLKAAFARTRRALRAGLEPGLNTGTLVWG